MGLAGSRSFDSAAAFSPSLSASLFNGFNTAWAMWLASHSIGRRTSITAPMPFGADHVGGMCQAGQIEPFEIHCRTPRLLRQITGLIPSVAHRIPPAREALLGFESRCLLHKILAFSACATVTQKIYLSGLAWVQ